MSAIYKTIGKKSRAALLANLARLRQSAVFSFTPFFVRVRSAQLTLVALSIDVGGLNSKSADSTLHTRANKLIYR
jgi:hypothetical protein